MSSALNVDHLSSFSASSITFLPPVAFANGVSGITAATAPQTALQNVTIYATVEGDARPAGTMSVIYTIIGTQCVIAVSDFTVTVPLEWPVLNAPAYIFPRGSGGVRVAYVLDDETRLSGEAMVIEGTLFYFPDVNDVNFIPEKNPYNARGHTIVYNLDPQMPD